MTKNIEKVFLNKISIGLLIFVLSSCSTYSSGFACSDAKGVPCTPMEEVHEMIESGEIEHYTARKRSRGCKGGNCSNLSAKTDDSRSLKEVVSRVTEVTN